MISKQDSRPNAVIRISVNKKGWTGDHWAEINS